MNTSVDTQKIEKLNQLKAQQAQIELEIQNQEKLAQNEIKKAEAIDSAKTKLKRKVVEAQLLNQFKTSLIDKYPELQATHKPITITETPWTYLFNGEKYDEKWQGAPIEENVLSIELKYQDYTLDIKPNGKVELPYSIANSLRQYTIKGAIKKIDKYINEQDRKEAQKNAKAKALTDAVDFLTRSIKQTGANATITHKVTGSMVPDYSSRSGSNKVWSEWNEITIQFENGNRLKYRVGYNSTGTFTLSLQEFLDTRITEIKKDPITSIIHLK
jgi:predicted RNA-binding protein Jag